MSRYHGLGFDPAPGNHRQVGALAQALADTAHALTDGHDHLTNAITTSGEWHGEAADAFRRQGAGLPTRLDATRTEISRAADILFGWAATLSDLNVRAEQQDRAARALRSRIADAEQAVDEWATAVSVASTHTRPAAEATLAEHENHLAGLRAELDSVLAKAREIAAEHRTAAGRTAALLRGLGSASTPASGSSTGIAALLNGLSGATRRAAVAAGIGRAGEPVGPPAGALAVAAAPPRSTGPSTGWVFRRSVPTDRLLATFPDTPGSRTT